MGTASVTPQVHGIFDAATWTVTYVVFEKPGSSCAIIDSVLDYDPRRKLLDYLNGKDADRYTALISKLGLRK